MENKEKLDKILKWERIQGLQALKNILSDFDRSELIIYQEANGETKNSTIAEEAGVAKGTVSNRLQEWNELHIVEKVGRKWKHIAPLESMGIDIPEENNE